MSGAAWHAENTPCAGSKRIRVYQQDARMCSTCARFVSTHGSVLNVHTETFLTYIRRGGVGRGGGGGGRGGLGGEGVSSLSFSLLLSLSFSLSLFLSSLLSFSLPSFSFSSLFLFSLPALVVSLSSVSTTMTMITRPVGLSLCTHGSNLPECQSACTLAHSLFGEHVRIMQETSVPGITVQTSCHLE